ncbi:hypothetical protein BWI93_07925 [Siphonobacter sp. BAB-5385]|nr:hypothetical protein BWI93_07925 [Siphonobacter sp. BAB-5385]
MVGLGVNGREKRQKMKAEVGKRIAGASYPALHTGLIRLMGIRLKRQQLVYVSKPAPQGVSHLIVPFQFSV